MREPLPRTTETPTLFLTGQERQGTGVRPTLPAFCDGSTSANTLPLSMPTCSATACAVRLRTTHREEQRGGQSTQQKANGRGCSPVVASHHVHHSPVGFHHPDRLGGICATSVVMVAPSRQQPSASAQDQPRPRRVPAQVLLTLFNCVCQGKNCYHIRLLSQQNGGLGPVFHVLHNVKRIVRNSAAVLQANERR